MADLGSLTPRIKPRERRLVTEYPWLGADEGKQRVIEKLKPPGDPRHPGPERASIDDQAAGGEHLGLAMQQQMPGELRDGDMGCKGRGHHAALHHACRRGRLHNNAFAGAACIARPDRPFDPDNRGHDVERLADVRADAMQFERTAGASLALQLDDLVITRKVLGQAADIAGWRSPCLRFVFIDRRDIIIRSNGNVAHIAKVGHCLCWIDDRHLLRFRPKELALEEGNARFEIGILFIERENDPGQLRSILG